ncbi:hypothetical protein cypCar_00008369, partial [Cyprinus carpio]
MLLHEFGGFVKTDKKLY